MAETAGCVGILVPRPVGLDAEVGPAVEPLSLSLVCEVGLKNPYCMGHV